MKRLLTGFFLVGLLFSAVWAADLTSETVKQVIDYYETGKGAPIVLDGVLCESIYKEGPNKWDPKDLVKNNVLYRNQQYYIWLAIFAPDQVTEKVYVDFKYNGVVQDTKEVTGIEKSLKLKKLVGVYPSILGQLELVVRTGRDDVLFTKVIEVVKK
jgi:hypothetical protein